MQLEQIAGGDNKPRQGRRMIGIAYALLSAALFGVSAPLVLVARTRTERLDNATFRDLSGVALANEGIQLAPQLLQ